MLADRYGTDKGSKHTDQHGYTFLYDLILGHRRYDSLTLLEIGLACGGPETLLGHVDRIVGSPSVNMWLDYFPKAKIVGFDISDFSHIQNNRFSFVRGDAGNVRDLERLINHTSGLDVIVDDGSHASFHQQFCLKHLWPHLRDGGLYIIEDLHWQSPIYEGTLPSVPLTADLFQAVFERGERFDTALFTASEIEIFCQEVASFGLFRDHSGKTSVPKVLVLRKQGGIVRSSPEIDTPHLANDSEALPKVRSFDLFDTLVARRCIWPKAVFDIMEQRLGLPGFATARVKAEQAVMRDHYSLEGIYKQLASDHPTLAARVDEIQLLEIGLEFQQLFPIAENVAKVSPGDIIVSDMYLPFEVLQTIVKGVLGLSDVFVFVTTQGKARGEVWSPLQSRFEIIDHMGDNSHSDFASPQAFGIPGRMTNSWEPTNIENQIGKLGFKYLKQASREARLTSWSWRKDERELQILQANVNAPMLLVASILVFRAARQAGIERILASGRDCYLWLHIISLLQEEMVPGLTSDYFLTGRVPRTFPSENYKAYVRRMVGGKRTFVLDLCGSGLSLARLLKSISVPTAQPLLIHKMKATTVRGRSASAVAADEGCRVYALLDPSIYYDNIPAELANPAPHPTVFDVVDDQGIDRPIYPNWPIEPITKRFAEIQEQAFKAALSPLLARPVLDELCRASSDDLVKVLAFLYGSFGLFSDTVKAQMPEQFAENRMVCSTVLEMERRLSEVSLQAVE